jgi:hypothetical protein
MALECFKTLHKLSPPCLNDLVVFKNSKYSFRYSNIVEIPRVKTNKNNQYALVHLIAVKLYDRYFLYVYQNLADSLYQYPEIFNFIT